MSDSPGTPGTPGTRVPVDSTLVPVDLLVLHARSPSHGHGESAAYCWTIALQPGTWSSYCQYWSTRVPDRVPGKVPRNHKESARTFCALIYA
eukprot:3671518-Rhodomonas_salina.1